MPSLMEVVHAQAATPWRLGHRPGLDGVRGIAILLVLAFHSSLVPIEAVGVAGVTVFFVLSGFLITRLLIEEHERGPIDLRGFYSRRARRLLPALLLMLLVTVAIRPDQWWSAAWALSYVGNWWWATGHDVGMYGYTWSLAIEEQFYLVWPALMLLGLRFGNLVWLLTALLLLRFVPSTDEMSAFSTFSHAPSILIGATLAFRPIDRKIRPMLLAIGTAATVAAFLLVTLLALQVGQSIVAAFGAVLVVAGLSGSFAWRPLRYLGRVSYGIYLWHLPILVIGTQEGLRGPLVGVVGCLLAIGVAALSYRFVERPLLAGRCRTVSLPLTVRTR